MNRNDWEKQVYASDLCPTARLLALAVGSFGNWTDERSVWPSTKALADMAGIHRNTAQKYMDALVEQGWLSVVKLRPGNVKEYELCRSVATPRGILAMGTRPNNLLQPEATDSNHLPHVEATGCYNENDQLLQPEAAVATPCSTNLKEPTKENLEELPIRQDEEIRLSVSEVSDVQVSHHSPNSIRVEGLVNGETATERMERLRALRKHAEDKMLGRTA